LDEAIAKSRPAFWECSPPEGFSYCKSIKATLSRTKLTHTSQGVGVRGILCLLLNSGRKIMPTSRREVDGIKVPSKCTRDFLQVLYIIGIGKMFEISHVH
jgi:hypothetical protein